MPQMFPIMWSFLFFSSLAILIIMSTLVHFFCSSKSQTQSKNLATCPSPNWKW